jgi:hypothetical protein
MTISALSTAVSRLQASAKVAYATNARGISSEEESLGALLDISA